MKTIINAKTLRSQWSSLIKRVKRGERFTVLHRSRPVCQIVPLDDERAPLDDLENDPLYRASALGRSSDGKTSAQHDEILYGKRTR